MTPTPAQARLLRALADGAALLTAPKGSAFLYSGALQMSYPEPADVAAAVRLGWLFLTDYGSVCGWHVARLTAFGRAVVGDAAC